MQPRPIVWWELASHDASKSADFLRALFGWEFTLDEKLGVLETPAGENAARLAGGGVFTLRRARLPFLTIYIEVDDIEDRARKVEELGGSVIEPPHDIGGGTHICLFNEPSGVTFAMLQRAKKP